MGLVFKLLLSGCDVSRLCFSVLGGRRNRKGLCLRVVYQQLGPKPNLSNLTKDALLILTAEERIIGPKNPRQHILQTIRDTPKVGPADLLFWRRVPGSLLHRVRSYEVASVLDGNCSCAPL